MKGSQVYAMMDSDRQRDMENFAHNMGMDMHAMLNMNGSEMMDMMQRHAEQEMNNNMMRYDKKWSEWLEWLRR